MAKAVYKCKCILMIFKNGKKTEKSKIVQKVKRQSGNGSWLNHVLSEKINKVTKNAGNWITREVLTTGVNYAGSKFIMENF